MKTVRRVSGAIAAVLLLLAAAVYGLLATTTGTRLMLWSAQQAGVAVTAKDIQGGVLGPLAIGHLQYANGGRKVEITGLQLHWRPSALIHKSLHVLLLKADVVDLTLPPGKPRSAKKSFDGTLKPLPRHLPMALALDHMAITRLVIHQGKAAPFELTDLTAGVHWLGNEVELTDVGFRAPSVGKLQINASATMLAEQLRLKQLLISGPFNLKASGEIGYNDTNSDVQLSWNHLQWPLRQTSTPPPGGSALPGSQSAESPGKSRAKKAPKKWLRGEVKDGSGQLHLSGTPKAYKFDLTAAAHLQNKPTQLLVNGHGGLTAVSIHQLKWQLAKTGMVRADGRVSWVTPLRADLRLSFSHFNPQTLLKDFPGDINGAARLRVNQKTVQFNVALDHSKLRGYPLKVTAVGSSQGERIEVKSLNLISGATQVQASGRVTPPYALKARIVSSNLASLYPGLSGSLNARLKITGTNSEPHIILNADGKSLAYRQTSIAKLTAIANLDPSKPSKVKIDVTDMRAGLDISRASLSLDGLEVYQQIHFEANTNRGDVRLSAAGGYNSKRQEWGGTLLTSRIQPSGLAALTLEKPAGILIGGKRRSLEHACWSGAAGRLCAQLEQNVFGQGLRLTLALVGLHLAELRPILPPNYHLKGEVTGNGQLNFSHGDIKSVAAKFNIKNARLKVPGAPELEALPSTLSLTDKNGKVGARLALALKHGTVDINAVAGKGPDFLKRPLSGSMKISVPDIAFLQSLIPQASSLAGAVNGGFAFSGQVARPILRGRMAMDNGVVRLSEPGITLKPLKLALQADGDGPLRLTGTADSGGGDLTIVGSIDPSKRPIHALLTIKGHNFQMMDTDQARVWISPDLSVDYAQRVVKLRGELNVPKADITPVGLTNSGISPSPDQVLVSGKNKAQRNTPYKVDAQLTIALGDKVNFVGFGLTTQLGGKVTLTEAPDRNTTFARGEMDLINGRYKAYGQDLSITQGRLIFTGGPVTQPGVELLATRHASSDVSVSVRVQGTLANPRLTLESNPPMPRDQQLAWLVLGHPLDQSSSGNQNAIASAALGLELAGGGYLANKVGKQLGLDTITVGSDTSSGSQVAASQNMVDRITRNSSSPQAAAASLVLGKYLTPRLFVSYGVGLLTPGNVFRLLYRLGHGFDLQAESGIASGGDLVYTVESK